jgi:hypothetical protein
MLHSASKAFFHLLARLDALKTLASRYGMREPTSFARRLASTFASSTPSSHRASAATCP